jgi:hypothetical protein
MRKITHVTGVFIFISMEYERDRARTVDMNILGFREVDTKCSEVASESATGNTAGVVARLQIRCDFILVFDSKAIVT